MALFFGVCSSCVFLYSEQRRKLKFESNMNLPLAAPLKQDASVIGLVGAAHLISHFSQLLLAPLFPWLKAEFNVTYAELGFLMTVFFVVSCAVQAASGFVVDKFGPRPVLFAGLEIGRAHV